jgi:hypothetical protein
MQRDMDLVRKILMTIEEHPMGFAPTNLEIEGYTDEQIRYHTWLTGQAGLAQVVENTNLADKSPSAIPISLTWDGYEFLAASKNENIWSKGKSVVTAKAGAIGFDIIKAFLVAEIKRQIGLP